MILSICLRYIYVHLDACFSVIRAHIYSYANLSHAIMSSSNRTCNIIQRNALSSSSPPRTFPIIWSRRNGIEYHSSTLSFFNPPFLYLFYTSLSTWFSVVILIKNNYESSKSRIGPTIAFCNEHYYLILYALPDIKERHSRLFVRGRDSTTTSCQVSSAEPTCHVNANWLLRLTRGRTASRHIGPDSS